MGLLLDQLLAYLMNLAAGLRTDAIGDARARRIQQQLANDTARVRAIQDLRSLADHLRLAGIRVAQALDTLDLTKRERPLFLLLTDETFQDDLAHWLTAFDSRKKAEQQEKILRRMGAVLQAEPEHVEQLRRRYFELVEKAVFADPVLAHWRLQLGISTVLERMDELHGELLRGRREGREMGEAMIAQLAAHGQHLRQMSRQLRDLDHEIFERFTEEQRRAALDRFRTLALDSCDIVDLTNLPEQDRHVAARQLELRRLYVPLRVSVEFAGDGPIGEEQLHEIEARREALRARQAAPEDERKRVPAGDRLAAARRLVVLGDPGSGKTTLLRWIATAYLLRLKNDPAWREIPDVDTLPEADWLPILIRCRDQDPESFAGGLDALLERTFRATELGPDESAALQPVLREKLARGEAVLLVDGLDEITQPAARMRFCQQIERLQAAYPEAPMVVTSRIVGYRKLGYRLGRTGGLERGFEHVTVAEFSRADKDDFARRWCRLTEVPERVAVAEKELIRDVHSSDRIERLTANPMLLTTMALVKRKIGRLPQRRAELYQEAVQVLLNWRAEVDAPIDQREAFYQLEYLAYEMCRRGVQRLRHDEIVALWDQMRTEYPALRPLKQHEPEEFLSLLERRTGILIEAGRVRHEGIETPVYEFRHLTFQEYLAGRALAYSRFPRGKGRKKKLSVAEHVAPLARQMQVVETEEGVEDMVVTENWREALRLCVTCCGDDDVDDVLLAILHPRPREKPGTARARAVMAALCLADEPNVSDATAREVLQGFASQVSHRDGEGTGGTSVDRAAIEVGSSEWAVGLRDALLHEFCASDPEHRWNAGGLWAMVAAAAAPAEPVELAEWVGDRVRALPSEDEVEAIAAALEVTVLAFEKRAPIVPGLIEGLFELLSKTAPAADAAAWALGWLADARDMARPNRPWRPTPAEVDRIVEIISDAERDPLARFWLVAIASAAGDRRASNAIAAWLNHPFADLRFSAVRALARLRDPRALPFLDQDDPALRDAAVQGLTDAWDGIDRRLLSRDLRPWVSHSDLEKPIDEARVAWAAKKLSLSEAEVRRRYEELAERFGGRLKLTWRPGHSGQ